MDKLLTVVVPSYNMEVYLRKALDSLLIGNTKSDALDVIVVNDGSTDGTLEIARDYAARFPEIVSVIDKENGNYGSCVNAGLAAARGMYIRILDADDTYDTTAFVRYMSFVEKEISHGCSIDLFFNDFDLVDRDGRVIEHTSYAFTGVAGFTLADFDYEKNPMVWNPAICYRTSLLRAIGYKQTEGVFYSDQQWDTIPMLSVRSTKYCPETVYRYLQGRPGQSCNAEVKLRNFAMHLPVAIEILRAYAKNKGSVPKGNIALVYNQQRSHVGFFYGTYLIRARKVLNDAELIDYDMALRKYVPELYEYAETLCDGNFLYVREWRKGYSKNTLKFKWHYFRHYVRHELKLLAPLKKFARWILRHGEYAN